MNILLATVETAKYSSIVNDICKTIVTLAVLYFIYKMFYPSNKKLK